MIHLSLLNQKDCLVLKYCCRACSFCDMEITGFAMTSFSKASNSLFSSSFFFCFSACICSIFCFCSCSCTCSSRKPPSNPKDLMLGRSSSSWLLFLISNSSSSSSILKSFSCSAFSASSGYSSGFSSLFRGSCSSGSSFLASSSGKILLEFCRSFAFLSNNNNNNIKCVFTELCAGAA